MKKWMKIGTALIGIVLISSGTGAYLYSQINEPVVAKAVNSNISTIKEEAIEIESSSNSNISTDSTEEVEELSVIDEFKQLKNDESTFQVSLEDKIKTEDDRFNTNIVVNQQDIYEAFEMDGLNVGTLFYNGNPSASNPFFYIGNSKAEVVEVTEIGSNLQIDSSKYDKFVTLLLNQGSGETNYYLVTQKADEIIISLHTVKDLVTEENRVEKALLVVKPIHSKQATDTRDISKMLSSLENEEAPSLAVLNNQMSINGKNTSHLDNVYVSLTNNNEPIYLYKQAFDWLSEDFAEDETRILSNVKFLTEGIDVPNLDAVIFLAPKKSQVDIVQAVGRIMRKFKDKEYGYIILPIVIPEGTTPESILDNNKKYEAVWQILNALRSVDERFSAMINKLELNRIKPENMDVIGIGEAPSDEEVGNASIIGDRDENVYQTSLDLDWGEIENAIYAKVVKKVGDRRYLEDWSEDVAKIAQRHIEQITIMISDKNSQTAIEFDKFLKSLQHNINESIDEKQAIEMLAQHLITAPIFEALFGEYSFVNNNPVSEAMDKIVEELSKFGGFNKEQDELKEFYDSVKLRAEGIDNAEAKQRIIITLYDKFFSKGFKETTQRLGIVFTPVEVVDFIVKSVDDVLKKHFGKAIEDEGVHILDPFTGTGTFIVRTLHYLKDKLANGEITLADITRKYMQELHANEIVLLSYYIAAINIESTFAEINHEEYKPFEGIVLTDTFESTEQEDTLDDSFFGTNDERLKRQQEVPITAIIGNPPYSSGQKSENDNNQNIEYPNLFKSIQDSYVASSLNYISQNTKMMSMYDSYVLSFRWASNRIGSKGIVGFVSNGSFIDAVASDGLRKSLKDEFNHLYIFNLRGDQRTQGETSRKEGGKIFGSGSRTPIAISILVKDGSDTHQIHYCDIGDYLSREEKLQILKSRESINNISWREIHPDENNDWLNQRDKNYKRYRSLADEPSAYFQVKDSGIATHRDTWVNNFSEHAVKDNVKTMIENYNEDVNNLISIGSKLTDKTINPYITTDDTKISWSIDLKKRAARLEKIKFEEENIVKIMYRPFVKKNVYRSNVLNYTTYKSFKTMPNEKDTNLFINIAGISSKNDFSLLMTNVVNDYMIFTNSRNFPRYIYEKEGLFDERVENIQSDEDFFYIYGILHSLEYRRKYSNDLKKALPRIPEVKDKEKYVEIGKKLADLHLNYEDVPAYDGVNIVFKSDNPTEK
ncbi:type ISP restriction/modification enzyme [Enterococcus hirae]